MSDPTLSDIDFKYKMACVWSTLNFTKIFSRGTDGWEFHAQRYKQNWKIWNIVGSIQDWLKWYLLNIFILYKINCYNCRSQKSIEINHAFPAWKYMYLYWCISLVLFIENILECTVKCTWRCKVTYKCVINRKIKNHGLGLRVVDTQIISFLKLMSESRIRHETTQNFEYRHLQPILKGNFLRI